ncbi:hypothetical protein GPECTOR_7g1159 [Gonium pectorale]|uniref:Guanylate cyclase domain-containing protein n=1 Tax=Gonium pectorale TaxID=33097 RepID=A0A150GTS5_GONPE|nr:hypothetical protein GPECTOR_7g1159 [Gonium pectorale]|eukprot:KXZ53265.1 hypothetical protein GPECTOR_7g1159 [Gonium pectorale]
MILCALGVFGAAYSGSKVADRRKDEKQLMYQIQLLPAAVLNYIYPPVSGESARLLIGRDMLQVPQYRNDTLYQIRQRDKSLIVGPYNLLEGFRGMFAIRTIFLPAPDPLYDWGCGHQPYDCPPGVCWLPTEGKKLWGLALSVLPLDGIEGELRSLSAQGYRYRLRQLAEGINDGTVIAASDPPPEEPISVTITRFNLMWVLEVAPASGWVPSWRDPCIAAAVVGSVIVSALVAWLLVARERHDALLSAMLPRKVISQLQRGEATVVEEFLEPVTILFTDIVSYTEVASQLTALQVVRLLNELYTRFDALCDKHGVYKAFMCVAGCPTREDPISAAVRMAGMAQDMIAMVEMFTARVGDEDMRVQIRVGLHSGPVVAGVIGQRMPRYCLFGDTVNTASRMETNSQPMCIHISAATASLLRMAGAAVMLPVRRPQAAAAAPPHPSQARGSVEAPRRSIDAPPSPLSIGQARPSLQLEPPASVATSERPSGLPATLSALLALDDTMSVSDPAGPQHTTRRSQARPRPPAGATQEHCLDSTADGMAVWRLAASGSQSLLPPLTLFGRGRVMIKGKGPMHTFWLGMPPKPPGQADPRVVTQASLARSNAATAQYQSLRSTLAMAKQPHSVNAEGEGNGIAASDTTIAALPEGMSVDAGYRAASGSGRWRGRAESPPMSGGARSIVSEISGGGPSALTTETSAAKGAEIPEAGAPPGVA